LTGRFVLRDTPLEGVKVIERTIIEDSRGYLERLYCADELRPVMEDRRIVQITHTMTAARGTVRGLHFQNRPSSDLKLVTCLRGEIFDVAVDLRRGSPTFRSWHAEILSDSNRRSLVIPEGFAHGFQALVDGSEIIYCHTAFHDPSAEAGFSPTDELLGIEWPQPVIGLSARDAGLPSVKNFPGVVL
jgi:dTDP-4-dehydrorhamnose 3,5-epimerase